MTDIVVAGLANNGVHAIADTLQLPMPTIGVLNGSQQHYSDSESEDDALAAGLERQLEENDSPVSLSELDEPSPSDNSFDESASDDDEDFVPRRASKKQSRPRPTPAYNDSDSDELGVAKGRKNISAVKRMSSRFSNSMSDTYYA